MCLPELSSGCIISTPEDEEVNDDREEDSDDEPINPLVDALFDEIEDLRLRVCMRSKLLGANP